MSLSDTIEETPLIDGHAHAVTPLDSKDDFPGFFNEAPGVSPHARHTVYWQAGRRLLEERFEGDTEDELLERRFEVDLASYTRTLFSEANIGAVIQDTGAPSGVTAEDFRRYTDATIYTTPRIESVAEELLDEHESFAGLEDAFEARLTAELDAGAVGLKSIVAYRSGLGVEDPSRSEAASGFVEERADWDGRLEHPDLLNYLTRRAVAIAGERDVPIQFHTGFGDTDAHPNDVDPGKLYDLMTAHPETDFVLLHGSYPYTRKAGYIASVLDNAYLDVGLAIPFIQHGCERYLERTLELAPTTKLLYSSDGYCVPEWHYLGAVRGRAALATVLDELVEKGYVSESYAESTATRILRGNAERLYGL